MADIVTLTATDGSTVEFYNEVKAQGGVKDVYFSVDGTYVVAFYRDPLLSEDRQRVESIVNSYKNQIFTPTPEGDYWKALFPWPQRIVEWNGLCGIVMPFYDSRFFFHGGKFDGKEKEGKWFATAKLKNHFLEADQKGDWLHYLQMCLNIARAVRRLHFAGLAHSDLSYKNVLVDPLTGSACVIDCDSLVVPGKYGAEVLGTPDFIAPEVLETQDLPPDDPSRCLPRRETDLHALAVLIYMYLLTRHPLRGRKVYDINDPQLDEVMQMGQHALFIEHPTDHSNAVNVADLDPKALPQGDPSQRPYTLTGPLLSRLFERAFINGLHDPAKRPTANEWEDALLKTYDLLLPCANPLCPEKWFVFNDKLTCPFCGAKYQAQVPYLTFYYHPHDTWMLDKTHIALYDKFILRRWHSNSLVQANEKATAEDKRPMGDVQFFQGQWVFSNRGLTDMEVSEGGTTRRVPVGSGVALTTGQYLVFDKSRGGRMAYVQILDPS